MRINGNIVSSQLKQNTCRLYYLKFLAAVIKAAELRSSRSGATEVRSGRVRRPNAIERGFKPVGDGLYGERVFRIGATLPSVGQATVVIVEIASHCLGEGLGVARGHAKPGANFSHRPGRKVLLG